jgi:hypothetical protein
VDGPTESYDGVAVELPEAQKDREDAAAALFWAFFEPKHSRVTPCEIIVAVLDALHAVQWTTGTLNQSELIALCEPSHPSGAYRRWAQYVIGRMVTGGAIRLEHESGLPCAYRLGPPASLGEVIKACYDPGLERLTERYLRNHKVIKARAVPKTVGG